MHNSLLLSGASIASGLLNAGVLALSARQGQTGEIASYTVVTGVLVVMSIVLAGGSTLLYVSGDDQQRRAVRAQRLLFVVPSQVVGVVLIGLYYTPRGYTWTSIIAMGLVVIGNNLAELQYADLTRQLRFATGAAVNCGTKVVALVLVAQGGPFTGALAAATVAQFVAAELVLRESSWLRSRVFSPGALGRARAAFRVNRPLHSFGLLELYIARAPSVVLSFVASPAAMGCFGAVVGVFQAMVAVLYAALQAPLAVRVRDRLGMSSGQSRVGRVEALTVLSATGVAVLGILCARWLTDDLLHLPLPGSAGWLAMLMAALPFLIGNQAVALRRIGVGNHRGATLVAAPTALFLTLILALAMPLAGPTGASAATFGAEVLMSVVLLVTYYRARDTRPIPAKET